MRLRRIGRGWLGVLIALGLLIGCATQPSVVVEPWPQFDALFAGDQGWTGGDGAYSVELSDGLILWLFGDTWIGKIQDGRHVDRCRSAGRWNY